jgi:PAS domain S-box-containing protein
VTGSSQISGDALLTTAARSSKLSAGVRARERRAETQDLARARDLFQGTLDSLHSHIAVLDERGEIIMINRAWSAFALANDAGTAEGVGANYLAACDAAEDDALATQAGAGLRAIIAGAGSEFTIEYPCHGPDVERWFALRASRYQGPGPARVVVAHEDITSRRAAEAEVATQAALLDEVDVAVVAIEPEGRVMRWSQGAERLLGWTRAEAEGRGAAELFVADQARAQEIIAQVRLDGHWEGKLTVVRMDGSTFPAYVRNRLMVDGDGQPTGRVAVMVDIAERVASERALLAAQNYMRAVADSMGEGLFTLDPDGHVVFMNEAAENLLGWTAWELRGRVMHDMTHSLRPDGSQLLIGDSPILGAHRDGVTVHVEDELFTRRDGSGLPVDYTAAPFVTDDGVEGCVVVFEDITERKALQESMAADVETLSWIGRIRDALAEDRFVLYEQPIIELRTGEVVQRELLLRMREPTGEIVGPCSYLPIAERYGLIGEIDRWVIERATEIAAAGGGVELNLSASSIGDPGLLDDIERALERTGADPRCLVFEITETALITDETAAKTFANRVHALGCKLALDDFGTGYGGFTYLKQFAVDFLKIDIEFVRDLPTNPASQHVVEAVVALARAFGLRTVAEGVEDARTLELLRELGVDFAQGYHIATPRPLARSGAPGTPDPSPEVRTRAQAQPKETS